MNKAHLQQILYGAAYGDSLGALTEFCTVEEIKKSFPNGLNEYCNSISLLTEGIVPGQVTDDFGSSCYIMQEILNNNGDFNKEIATEAILKWSADEVYFNNFAGENTRRQVEKLKKGVFIDPSDQAFHFMGKNSNGGAMKAVPLGLLANGDFDLAVKYAIDLCWPTHFNSAAVSATAAITCAISEATKENTSIKLVIEKAIQGSKIAREEVEEMGYISFGPYVENKIIQAINLASECKNVQDIIKLLSEELGTGIQVQETIPAVFAILSATNANFDQAIYCAVNAGGDTDTIALMVGAISAALSTHEILDHKIIEQIQESNRSLHLKETINDFTKLILERKTK